MRVVIVEPFLGGSHESWARGYKSHSANEVTILSHMARFWKWRMQGAHVTLAGEFESDVAAEGSVEVVVGSSMLNAAGFLGLVRRTIGSAGFVLYMHENQLGYPLSPRDKADQTYPMINWTSMVAADLIVFNSEYHRDQWFASIPGFLRQFPDYSQESLVRSVAKRSVVLPVGIDLKRFDGIPQGRRRVPRILWNQRWEYDKGPDEFARAISGLDERGVDFEVVLAGEQFPTDPDAFVQLRRRLGDRLVHYGWAEPDEYAELLASSDIVVSTAHHEFFGVAITEAIYAGAFPILPNRLVYPERIPSPFHDRCLYRDESELVDLLRWAVLHQPETRAMVSIMRPAMATADWSQVAPRYDDEFGSVAAG